MTPATAFLSKAMVLLVLMSVVIFKTCAFPVTPPLVLESLAGKDRTHTVISTQTNQRSFSNTCHTTSRAKIFGPCPEQHDLEWSEMDRREAAFALLGTVWSLGGVVPAVAINAMLGVQPSNAAYGEDAKLSVPNFMEGLDNRINKQCLVESLGNRECLLYLDPASKLYQGADAQVLISRLEKASEALGTIPALIDKKKWSQVIGVLTGPMGGLVLTMDQLTKLTDKPESAKELSKLVKADVINIGSAAERKQGDKALEFSKLATDHLVQFVSSL